MPSMYKRQVGWAKQCANCKTEYSTTALNQDDAYTDLRKFFSPRRNSYDGMESSCFRCRAIAEMRIKFGIDVESMIIEQGGVCKICKTEIQFNTGNNAVSACVDHNHTTGETRGILCRHCNLGLGHFKDNTDLLKSAMEYLEEWKSERKGVETTIGRDK